MLRFIKDLILDDLRDILLDDVRTLVWAFHPRFVRQRAEREYISSQLGKL